MDKSYYYRMLGLTGEPTPTQIKRAYNERMAKLRSSDYGDDPEYARKKMKQATMAYKVLMGDVPAPTQKQKRDYFERFKDSIENREGNEKNSGGGEGRARRTSKFDARPMYEESRGPAKSTVHAGKTPKNKAAAAGIIALIAVGIITTFISALIDFIDWNDVDYEYYEDGFFSEEAVEDAYDWCEDADFFEMLGKETPYDSDAIDWNEGMDCYAESLIFQRTFALAYELGITDILAFYDDITGEDDYYYEHDDWECAMRLLEFMHAPGLEDVVGMTNSYNGEQILSYSDYFEYLGDFINDKYDF